MKLTEMLKRELEGVEHRIEDGKRHQKLFVGGRFVGIMPRGSTRSIERSGGRATLNLRAQIRRAKRELGLEA